VSSPRFHRQRGKGEARGEADLAAFMAWATELVTKAKPRAVRVQTADFTCSWKAKKTVKPRASRASQKAREITAPVAKTPSKRRVRKA
jgi:hypothetical protein